MEEKKFGFVQKKHAEIELNDDGDGGKEESVPFKDSLRTIESDIGDCDKLLKENKREVDMIDSDLGRIHRKFLIEN